MDPTPTLLVTVLQWPPFILVNKAKNGSLEIAGMMSKMLEILEEKVGFRSNLTLPPDLRWGAMHRNGTFSGMFGMAQRKEVDVILGPIYISAERFKVVDPAFPMMYDAIHLIYRTPEELINYESLGAPFSAKVWFALLVSLGVASCVLYALNLIIRKAVQETINIPNPLIYFSSMIVLQSSKYEIKSDYLRLLIIFWTVSCFVLAKSYEGFLTANMAVRKVKFPINDLHDLVNQNKIPWKVEKEAFIHDLFKLSETELSKLTFKGLSGTFDSCLSNVTNIINGEYVAICEKTSIDTMKSWDYSTNKDCNLYSSPKYIYQVMGSIAMSKNLPVYDDISIWTMRIWETGLIQKWVQEKDKSYYCQSLNKMKSETVVINLKSTAGFFVAYILGNVLACFIFVFELTCVPKKGNY